MSGRERWPDAEPGESEFARTQRWNAGEGCPPPDVLAASRFDVLPEELSAATKRHLETCLRCRRLVAEMDDPELNRLGADGERRIRARIPAGHRVETRLCWWVPALAAAAVLLAVLLAPRPSRPPQPTPPAVTKAEPAKPREYLLALSKPPVRLAAAEVLVFRGEDAAPPLVRALQAYRADNYAEAVRLLEPAAKARDATPEAGFYLGVSLLHLNRPAEAARVLEAARGGDLDLARDRTWFLAVAHERNGDRAKALALLRELCAGEGLHRAESCAAAESMER